MSRRVFVCILLAFAVATPAAADFQVRGRFLYRDRAFGPGGFTGADTDLPIRLADVDVYDSSTSVVLASGATDGNGNFTIQVTDNTTRNVRVRVKTIASNTPSFKARVLNSGAGNSVFAVTTNIYTNHAPTADIDFTSTPVVALQFQGGDAFNIFDVVLDAFDFVASLHGSRPAAMLTCFWSQGSGDGTYFQGGDNSIHLFGLSSDSDGYDDSVIIHEVGHYVEANLSRTNNPGGQHSLDRFYDLRLTWSEGVSTFFQNLVRDWKGLSRPDIYVDTRGQPGTGQAIISYEVETPSVGQMGANNEVSVNACLWDLYDKPSTPDATSGTDDDVMAIANPALAYWRVIRNYLPGAQSVSLEDFWDGWFAPSIANGYAAEMRSVFGAQKVEYFPDDFEDNDNPSQAKSVVGGSPPTHHTIYGIGDFDWIQVAVAAGGAYVFETTNLLSGADTRLDLYASNGTTLLASNDDRISGDPSSRIAWTAGAADLVYLRCQRKPDFHTYGSYDLLVTGPAVPVEVSDISLQAVADGIELRWRALPSAGFSHFDVERRDAGGGAYLVQNAVPVEPEAGDAFAYRYLDANVTAGRSYDYRLVGVEDTGERRSFGPFTAAAPVPPVVALHAPVPNPFNPTTAFRFELPRAASVSARIYAADGRLVRTLLAARPYAVGTHVVRWDGRDDFGAGVASGVYAVVLDAAGERRTQRAVLLR